MAKHVIKKDQTDTVEVTESNSHWIVEKGVTLSGAPALWNGGFDDVGFVIDGKIVTAGNGLATGWTFDGEYADNTSVLVGASGRVTAGNMGILSEGDGTSITNRGLVDAQETALYFSGADVKIENFGEIISESNAAIGSEFGGNFLIRNEGLLRSTGADIAVGIWFAQGKLINGEGGVIDGAVSLTDSTGGATVVNRGEISGAPTVIHFGGGDDRLVNRGEIGGEISLGGGDDFADLRKGKLTNSAVEGGDGNDMFLVDRTDISIIELSGGGFDTIQTTVSYTLGNLDTDDIEILGAIGKKDIDLGGNDLNNILAGNVGDNAISGGGGADLLTGYKGKDMLTGGGDSDSFSFAKTSGVDTITDFSLGEDDIQIKYIAGIDDFADLQSRMSSADFDKDGDLDTIINLGDGNRIRLTDIAKDDLQMGDFLIFTA